MVSPRTLVVVEDLHILRVAILPDEADAVLITDPLYRRLTPERWERVRDGWPEPPSTIAPLLCAGGKPGEMWAADERGVHRSDDRGKSWRRVAGCARSPQHLRGLALLQ
jgi:hypothetical protein